MVVGEDKASALKEVLEGIHQPDIYPAQIIQPKIGTLTWMIDKGSARNLGHGNSSLQ
jgi:6-phosphogluconolactonase